MGIPQRKKSGLHPDSGMKATFFSTFIFNWSVLLIVLCVNLKIALRVIADRTYLRCFCSDHDMSAVAALPYLYFALLEYGSCLYIFQESTITLFVMFLDLADHTEFCCQCMETFLISGLWNSRLVRRDL